jgi:hypothetical protein
MMEKVGVAMDWRETSIERKSAGSAAKFAPRQGHPAEKSG